MIHEKTAPRSPAPAAPPAGTEAPAAARARKAARRPANKKTRQA
jgi:hypothetical protein